MNDELLIGLVSISDRASSGVYEDKGLPALQEWFGSALASPWKMVTRLIPDEQPVIEATLKELVDEKSAIIRGWIAEGKLNAVDPHHLIFAIWATTQHYADFEPQVSAITGNPPDLMQKAEETLTRLFVEGLRPRA